MIPSWVLNCSTFLAAFLLFQIELIIAKILLPAYGGSYVVWGGCIVFFQAALLLGYVFSHFAIVRYGIQKYRIVHLALCCLPLFVFPGKPLGPITSIGQLPLVVDIFWQLLRTIGPAFFVLSTMSIVMQAWVAASDLKAKQHPYFLYAVSNAGSLLGLITYPFIFEFNFDLNIQLEFWRWSYFILILLQLVLFCAVPIVEIFNAREREENKGPIDRKQAVTWLLFGAAGVMMFLSATNVMTAEVAPMPLLWIMPLGFYLLSYILNFKSRPWCPKWIDQKIHWIIVSAVLVYFVVLRRMLPFLIGLALINAAVFLICMYCQNELIKRKPSSSRQLTLFYVLISLGGFLGGIFLTWVVPLISVNLVEYFLSLFVLTLTFFLTKEQKAMDHSNFRIICYWIMLLVIWPAVFEGYHLDGFILLVGISFLVFSSLRHSPLAINICLALLICLSPFLEMIWMRQFYIFQSRNYYGIYKIFQNGGIRCLVHGMIIHGAQFLNENKQEIPLTYYDRITPIGEILSSPEFEFNNIGVVGLGAGALTSYIRRGQSMDFFELDPDIEGIAKTYFSYLNSRPGQVRVLLGDARVTVHAQPSGQYQLIIVDAFSGDTIPYHLLTVEAIEDFRRILSQDGILLFHISNLYVNLAPVLWSNARVVGAFVDSKSNKAQGTAFASHWVAMTWSRTQQDLLIKEYQWTSAPDKPMERLVRPWTDKYSNIVSALRLDNLSKGLTNFKPLEF